MSSRPFDFDISKLRIYFVTNAIFISGILKETLLSTFESTHFFIYSKLESCMGSFSFEATLARYLLKALAISTSLDTNSLSTFMPRIFS